MVKKRFYYIILLFVTTVCLGTIISVSQTFANSMLTDEELEDYSLNDIMFYDPCGGGSGGSGGTCGIKVSGSTMEEKVWNGLTSFLTEEQAAGVMGNMRVESAGTFSPAVHEIGFLNNSEYSNFDISNDAGASYGIGLIQWSGGRRLRLYNAFKESDVELWNKYIDEGRRTYGDAKLGGDGFLKKVGDDVANRMVEIELCYLKYELETYKEYSGLFDEKEVPGAAKYFLLYVESPANAVGQIDNRTKLAQEYYDKFHGKSFSGSSGSSGSDPACNGQNNNNIAQTAIDLAWPEGTNSKEYSWGTGSATDPFVKAMHDVYKNSYKHWDSFRRVGAACDVFVGTVVRYSGYDKKFTPNSGDVVDYVNKNEDLWEKIEYTKESEIQSGDIIYKEYRNKSGGITKHVEIAIRDEDNKLKIAKASYQKQFGHITSFSTKHEPKYLFRAKKAVNGTSDATGTVTNTSQGNGDIGASALKLAWPYGTEESKYKKEATPEFAEYYVEIDPDNSVHGGRSCDRFVSTVVKYSGLDKEIPSGDAPAIQKYLASSDKWEEVQMKDYTSTKEYKDGDVIAFGDPVTHVGIYVDDNGKGRIAQAAYGGCTAKGDCNDPYYGVVKDAGNLKYYSTIRVYRNKYNGSSTVDCDVCAGGDEESDGDYVIPGLKNMTLAEAQEFMKPYHDAAMSKKYGYGNKLAVGVILPFDGADVRTDTCPFGTLNNCVAFSQWFVNRYTTLGPNWNNTSTGKEMADRLGEYGFDTGVEPELYAVFSTDNPWTHTGVVLGIDQKKKELVIGEASCSSGQKKLYYEPRATTVSFATAKSKNYKYAYAGRKLKSGVLDE